MTIPEYPKYNEVFPDANFPISSGAAHTAYRYFWSRTHQNDQHPDLSRADQERMSITGKILESFCGQGDKAICDEAYEAGVLSDLDDIAHNPTTNRSRNARRALKEYFKNFENEKYEMALASGAGEKDAASQAANKVQYVAGLLSDRDKIRQFWNNETSPESPQAIFEWNNLSELVDLDKMLDLAKTVNIESILIMAAQLTHRLTKHADDLELIDDERTMDDIRLAESLVAPLLEIMGYDGFAMNLHSAAKRIRLKNLGPDARLALQMADDIVSEHNENRVKNAILNVTNGLVGAADKEPVFEFNEYARVLMEHGYCQPYGLPDDSPFSYFIARRKTRGSIAWKLYQDYQNPESQRKFQAKNISEFPAPMDIIAATIVFDDKQAGEDKVNEGEIEKLATAFAEMVHRAITINSDVITLKPSISRDSAVHVRGTRDFRAVIAGAVYKKGYVGNLDAKKEQPGGMEVAKLTFDYHDGAGSIPLSFEIQLITERQRNAMRTDTIAHIFYKLGISDPTPEQIACLKEIHGRKDSVQDSALVDPTAARAYLKFVADIDTATTAGAISLDALLR